jgi:hypothetical protein
MSRISQRHRIDFLSQLAVGCSFGAVMLRFVHWEDHQWLNLDAFKDVKGLGLASASVAHICGSSTPMVDIIYVQLPP